MSNQPIWQKSIHLENLITNGSFETDDNLAQWTVVNDMVNTRSGMRIVSNNTFSIDGLNYYAIQAQDEAASFYIYRTIVNLIPNHKYYYNFYEYMRSWSPTGTTPMRECQMVTTDGTRSGDYMNVNIGRKTKTSENGTEWSKCSCLFTLPTSMGGCYISYGHWHNTGVDTNTYSAQITCTAFALYDLTEAFGAGNEPSQEWCDQNLDFAEIAVFTVEDIQTLDVITDRTFADVSEARIAQSTISYDIKGCYNASDLTRVETNCRILADYLTYLGYACTIETKTNWVMADIPYLTEHINRIRYNTIKIIKNFLRIENAPEIIVDGYMDYMKANTLEQIYQMTIDMITALMEQYVLCGQHICGELY